MTTLIFEHAGWEVATTSWTVAAKPGKGVTICYQWGADGVSFFESAVGNARTTLDCTMAEFLRLIQGRDVVDFRRFGAHT